MGCHRSLKRLPICLLGVLALAGCSGGSTSSLKTVPVKGKITYKGQALVGATVMFLNQDQNGRPAGGQTDAQGEYTLTTMESGTKVAQGALPGEYKVAITKLPGSASPDMQMRPDMTEEEMRQHQEKLQSMSPEEMKKMGTAGQGEVTSSGMPVATKSEIPEKYGDPGGSGLTASVKPGGEPINFDLTE